MIDYKKTAQKAVKGGCQLIDDNPNKLTTTDVINKDLTITAFDILGSNDKTFAVVTFKEFPGAFYCGGSQLTSICESWADACDGDIKVASDGLAVVGGVKVTLKAIKTKHGNSMIAVDII